MVRFNSISAARDIIGGTGGETIVSFNLFSGLTLKGTGEELIGGHNIIIENTDTAVIPHPGAASYVNREYHHGYFYTLTDNTKLFRKVVNLGS